MNNEQNSGRNRQPEDMNESESLSDDFDSVSPAVAAYRQFRETRIENRDANIDQILLQLDAQNAKQRLLQRLEHNDLLLAPYESADVPLATGLFASIRRGWQGLVGGQRRSFEDGHGAGNRWFASYGSPGSLGIAAAVAVLVIVFVPRVGFDWNQEATPAVSYASTPQLPVSLLAIAAQEDPGDRLHSITRGSENLSNTASRFFWLGRAVAEFVLQLAAPESSSTTTRDNLDILATQFEETDLSEALIKIAGAASQEPPQKGQIDVLLSELNQVIAKEPSGATDMWWLSLGKSVVAMEYSLVWENDKALSESLDQFELLFPIGREQVVSEGLVTTIERLRTFVGQQEFQRVDRQVIVNSLKRISRLMRS